MARKSDIRLVYAERDKRPNISGGIVTELFFLHHCNILMGQKRPNISGGIVTK